MELELINNRLAPCGLNCGNCYAFVDVDIKKLSHELKKSLGNFDVYAERFTEMPDRDIFKKYPDFKELLAYFSATDCHGCRKETCKIFKDCRVRQCTTEKQPDFCFQCSYFLRDNTGFDDHLQKRFIGINRRLYEIGVEKYYDEIKDKPRYLLGKIPISINSSIIDYC